jgi:hypothetical protein
VAAQLGCRGLVPSVMAALQLHVLSSLCASSCYVRLHFLVATLACSWAERIPHLAWDSCRYTQSMDT